jgi:hypothetical protein
MIIKRPLEQTLCLQYCTYYKPDKNEALACRGYAVVERFLREGKNLVVDDHRREFEPAAAELIVNKMCTACDFHEHDCDFMQNRSARPCGGFVLLSQLLESGAIAIEDIG